jgi:hypothetical protein
VDEDHSVAVFKRRTRFPVFDGEIQNTHFAKNLCQSAIKAKAALSLYLTFGRSGFVADLG